MIKMIEVFYCTRDLHDGSYCVDFFRSVDEFEKVKEASPDGYWDSDLSSFEVPGTGTIEFIYDELVADGDIQL